MNEAEEKKAYEDWLHQSPEFADTIISAWDVWLARAALSAQPEREACAKVCESEGLRVDASWASCAAAIRARGK
jgi:hypothetical protein